jgi:hypothetical protein
VEVLIDVERIKCGIESTVPGAKAEAALGVGHQRMEVGDVGLVKGLGEFGEHELTPARHLGGDDAGSVAPVELADRDLGRDGIVPGCGRGCFGRGPLVAAALAAQATVRVAGRLLGFVEAILDLVLLALYIAHSGLKEEA